jgi:hypothetical protein
MQPDPKPDTLDLLWGIDAIAAFIGRSRSQTHNALAKGELPARLINGRWVASRARLRQFFDEVAA